MSCTPVDLPPDIAAVRQKIHSIKTSPSLEGIFCLCNDGVMRSFSSSKAVVDALPLNNQEIMSSCVLVGLDEQEAKDIFGDIDGYQVPPEKLFNPDDGILPENLRGGPGAVSTEK